MLSQESREDPEEASKSAMDWKLAVTELFASALTLQLVPFPAHGLDHETGRPDEPPHKPETIS